MSTTLSASPTLTPSSFAALMVDSFVGATMVGHLAFLGLLQPFNFIGKPFNNTTFKAMRTSFAVICAALSATALQAPAGLRCPARATQPRRSRVRVGVGLAVPAAAGDPVAGTALALSALSRKACIFGALFCTSALLHAAEVAITTLYPWKVKEFATAEGPKSSFALLDRDITRVLTTILVATTCCNIASTALFADMAVSVCGGSARKLAYATAMLTAGTLFFGELLPKAIGVNNAERTARLLAPPINIMTKILGPVAIGFAGLSKKTLKFVGLIKNEGSAEAVSEEELRLIIGGASESGGIETNEGEMIEGVLDLQDTRVAEIMQPRVNVKALERNATMLELLRLVNSTGHSRVPVYDDEIDKIVGVVNAKKLLKFMVKKDPDADAQPIDDVLVAEFVEETYFVPETMLAWKVLEEMRRRRLHMAIVVDEYGGTAGMVTLEDILEVVVGEIYDEDDTEERDLSEYVTLRADNRTYDIRGDAALDDLVEVLVLRDDDGAELDADAFPDVTTAAGWLCFHAGEIPGEGDHIIVNNYDFTVTEADERRVLRVTAVCLDSEGALDKKHLPDLCSKNESAAEVQPAKAAVAAR